MTIEEKAAAYDVAYQNAVSQFETLCDSNDGDHMAIKSVKSILRNLFPGISEDDDEIIRRWLVKETAAKYTVDNIITNHLADKALAWLEKQKKTNGDYGLKFKIGDWITNGIDTWHITGMDFYEADYVFDKGRSNFKLVDNVCHIWTIKDAKDGDILNSENAQATIIYKQPADDGKHIIAYCGLQRGTLMKYQFQLDMDFEPASPYRVNMLFKKIMDEGFEWDDIDKKLKLVISTTNENGK